MRGYCYIAHVHVRPPDEDFVVVKIGRSIDPSNRFKELRSMAWNGPYLMEAAECDDRGIPGELYMHHALADRRFHGEWFYLPALELVHTKNILSKKFNTQFFEVDPIRRGVA